MTAPTGHHDPLAALAERACTAAGTTLATVLADLRDGEHHPDTPAALRAGWEALDIPTRHPHPEQP